MDQATEPATVRSNQASSARKGRLMPWVYLALAIVAEVAGTLQLRGLAGSSVRALPIVLVTICYVVSFGFMTLALRHIGVGAVYAIWSGVGTFSVAVLGQLLFAERVRLLGAIGMALIVGGVVLVVLGGAESSAGSSTPNPSAPGVSG